MLKKKKKMMAEIHCIFECFFETQLNKTPNSPDTSRPCGRVFKNPKTGALGNYFCLKMIPKLASQ